MTPEETNELLEAYREGALNDQDAVRLAETLEADPQASIAFLKQLEFCNLLAHTKEDFQSEVFVRSFLERLRAEETKTEFVRAFEAKQRKQPFWSTRWIHWPRPFWVAFCSLCTLMVLGIGTFMASRTELIRAGFLRTGPGVIVQRGNRKIPANEIVGLRAGDVIQTPAGSTAVVQYQRETTQVELKENTELKLAKSRKGKHLELKRGQIEATVASQTAERPMVIITTQARATILGTHFKLASKSSSTWLEVEEGSVKLTRAADDSSLTVQQGSFAVAAAGLDFVSHPLLGNIPPTGPIPVKLQLFSEFQAENSAWHVSADQVIQQRQLATGFRTFRFKPFTGSFLVEVIAIVDQLGAESPDGSAWGLGLGVARRDPVLQIARPVYLFQSSQHEERPSFFRFKSETDARQVPYSHPLQGACHLKLRGDRRDNKTIQLSAKIWQMGTPEPVGWMITSPPITLDHPLDHVVLSTERIAATFKELRLSFIE